jgi:hypothetical protein
MKVKKVMALLTFRLALNSLGAAASLERDFLTGLQTKNG